MATNNSPGVSGMWLLGVAVLMLYTGYMAGEGLNYRRAFSEGYSQCDSDYQLQMQSDPLLYDGRMSWVYDQMFQAMGNYVLRTYDDPQLDVASGWNGVFFEENDVSDGEIVGRIHIVPAEWTGERWTLSDVKREPNAFHIQVVREQDGTTLGVEYTGEH